MSAALIAFLVWTLMSVGFGLALGAMIRYADAAEQPQPEQLDTQVIDWADRPAAWL